jgi:hypothetical protein
MAKKVSKWFRIGVEGDTCDGRVISGDDIQDMADTFDPRVYGCRINLEHLRVHPRQRFKRYGDVVELKAEIISDDSALNGKKALFGKIAPLDELVSMVRAGQKVYTSIRRTLPTAANATSSAWRSPMTRQASARNTSNSAAVPRKTRSPVKRPAGRLFSVASLAELEFEDVPDTMLNSLTDKVKAIFSRNRPAMTPVLRCA